MGYRMHYHTKHEIEYGGGDFSHMQEQIYELLCKYGCTVYSDNNCDACYASEFSVPFEEIESMLDALREHDPNEIAIPAKEKWNPAYTIREIIEYFQEAYDNADKDNSDIYFSWY